MMHAPLTARRSSERKAHLLLEACLACFIKRESGFGEIDILAELTCQDRELNVRPLTEFEVERVGFGGDEFERLFARRGAAKLRAEDREHRLFREDGLEGELSHFRGCERMLDKEKRSEEQIGRASCRER